MPQAKPNVDRVCFCGTRFQRYVAPSRPVSQGQFCSVGCAIASRRHDDSPAGLLALLQARLEDKPNGCREWTGPRRPDGYGVLGKVNGKTYATHRLAYTLFVGPIPPGASVLHKCDNPPCCNEEHLFTGTKAENNKDRDLKGRKWSILTESDVRQIRQRLTGKYGNQAALAREFRVSEQAISAIARGMSWRGVTD